MFRRLINRRQFLGTAGASLAAAASARYGLAALAPLAAPKAGTTGLALSMQARQQPILPGNPTDVLKFEASMSHGSGGTSLQFLPNSYLGPVIRTRKNEVLEMEVLNGLDEPSVVHWHGLDSPPMFDGHPQQAIPGNSRYKARLPIVNRAGTYWYHPHPHMLTATQVYHGLAGLIVVSDDEEQALDLPRQQYDVPLVLQDRSFDPSNQFAYAMSMPNGMLGDRILVNGQPDYVLPAANCAYRFRLLNGSNSRIYKLAWSHGLPMTVIGTDGGLLRRPVHKKYVTLAPGERVELWTDFSRIPLGQEVVLSSLEFSGTGFVPAALPQGAAFEVMRVRVERPVQKSLRLPEVLSSYEGYDVNEAVNRDNPRSFPITKLGQNFLLNGGPFDPNYVAPNERFRLGDLEVWEFSNPGGPSHIAHPIHVHGPHFQVLQRIVAPNRLEGWNTVRWGYTDEGWKDTVLLMPGETIRILTRFDRYAGMSMYHCHNLEHEDMGMMRNLMVMA